MMNEKGKSLGQIVERTKLVLESVNNAIESGQDKTLTTGRKYSALYGISSKSLAGIQQISMTSEELQSLTQNLENLINSFESGN